MIKLFTQTLSLPLVDQTTGPNYFSLAVQASSSYTNTLMQMQAGATIQMRREQLIKMLIHASEKNSLITVHLEQLILSSGSECFVDILTPELVLQAAYHRLQVQSFSE